MHGYTNIPCIQHTSNAKKAKEHTNIHNSLFIRSQSQYQIRKIFISERERLHSVNKQWTPPALHVFVFYCTLHMVYIICIISTVNLSEFIRHLSLAMLHSLHTLFLQFSTDALAFILIVVRSSVRCTTIHSIFNCNVFASSVETILCFFPLFFVLFFLFLFCFLYYFFAFHILYGCELWMYLIHEIFVGKFLAIPELGCCFTVIYATLLNIPFQPTTMTTTSPIASMFFSCLVKHFVDLYVIFCLYVALDIMCILYETNFMRIVKWFGLIER